jgi:hypothetical protein
MEKIRWRKLPGENVTPLLTAGSKGINSNITKKFMLAFN